MSMIPLCSMMVSAGRTGGRVTGLPPVRPLKFGTCGVLVLFVCVVFVVLLVLVMCSVLGVLVVFDVLGVLVVLVVLIVWVVLGVLSTAVRVAVVELVRGRGELVTRG